LVLGNCELLAEALPQRLDGGRRPRNHGTGKNPTELLAVSVRTAIKPVLQMLTTLVRLLSVGLLCHAHLRRVLDLSHAHLPVCNPEAQHNGGDW
jgi:hypothetical protein